MKNRSIFFIFLLASLFLLNGCSNNKGAISYLGSDLIPLLDNSPGINPPTPPSSSTVLALGTAPGNKLVLKQVVKATGVATTLQTYSMPGAIGSFQLAKNNTRLFVQINDNNLYYYGIDSSTALPTITLLSQATVPGGPTGLWGVCAAPDASSAHLVHYSTTNLYSFKVDSNDNLTFAGTNASAPAYLVNCQVTADSKYVIAAGYNAGATSFQIDATTRNLNKVLDLGAGGGPSWLQQSADSHFFFVPSQDDGGLHAFEMNLTTGQFAEVDSKSLPGAYPDFVDVSADGTQVYVHDQNGHLLLIPFDRTTKHFGASTLISDTTDWFTLDKVASLIFQDFGSDTGIYPLKSDGTEGPQGSYLTGEGSFQTFVF